MMETKCNIRNSHSTIYKQNSRLLATTWIILGFSAMVDIIWELDLIAIICRHQEVERL